MSLIKGKREQRTILDFSQQKLSKNLIAKSIRKVEVLEAVRMSEDSWNFINNTIKVGHYNIHLIFSYLDAGRDRKQLREYGGFQVAISCDTVHSISRKINLNGSLFKDQKWVSLNEGYNLRMKDLPDIIMYLNRLDNLSAFN